MLDPQSGPPGRSGAVRNEIARERLSAWFAATAGVAVRIVCAPVGTGKTFAVRQYARAGARAAYLRVPEGADAATLRQLLARADGAAQIVLDDADRADPAAYRELVDEIAADDGRGPRLVLVGRSRRRLLAHALLARGLAVLCPADLLAFDAREIAELADAFGLAHDDHDVAQVLHDTEGWALAVQWLARDAAETGRPLRDAFAHWREHNGYLLLEFIENERYEDADLYDTFRHLLVGSGDDLQHELDRLEQVGLPLVRTRSGVRPYRLLTRLVGHADAIVPDRTARAVAPLMMLNVLGRFRCEIGTRPVSFARRRDQHVFVFVALSPGARTTRERILDAFWPETDRRIAAQGLRTTLSRIRRAIADAAPGVDADRYFQTTGEVRLDPSVIAVDVRRFVDHVEEGRLDDARGAVEGAKQHYRVAYRLYADRLLASEAPESCFAGEAERLERIFIEALTRLTQLHAALGEIEAARDYARELLDRNCEEARRAAMLVFATGPAVHG